MAEKSFSRALNHDELGLALREAILLMRDIGAEITDIHQRVKGMDSSSDVFRVLRRQLNDCQDEWVRAFKNYSTAQEALSTYWIKIDFRR